MPQKSEHREEVVGGDAKKTARGDGPLGHPTWEVVSMTVQPPPTPHPRQPACFSHMPSPWQIFTASFCPINCKGQGQASVAQVPVVAWWPLPPALCPGVSQGAGVLGPSHWHLAAKPPSSGGQPLPLLLTEPGHSRPIGCPCPSPRVPLQLTARQLCPPHCLYVGNSQSLPQPPTQCRGRLRDPVPSNRPHS